MGITLDGVTTACVLFLFACQIVPSMIRNRTQYYAAFGCVLGIILINTVALMLGSPKFNVFAGVVVGFLQFVAVLMLVLSAGGQTVKSLAGEMGRAYEVIRRGEDEKEIIVPLSGEMPMKRSAEDAPRERIEIVTPPTTVPTPQPPEEKIPLHE